MKRFGLLLTLLSLCFSNVFAADFDTLPKKKQTQLGLYLTAKQAHEMMQKEGEQVLFLDIRSRAEVSFLGMPEVADANIPFMELDEFFAWDAKKKNFKMAPVTGFTSEVEKRLAQKGLDKSGKIIVMCRSGSRSSKAADYLAKQGFTQVYSVVDGFEGDKAKSGAQKGQRVVNGWKNTGLPWTYKLDQKKLLADS